MTKREQAEFRDFIISEIYWYAKYLLYDENLGVVLKIPEKPKKRRDGSFVISPQFEVMTDEQLKQKIIKLADFWRFPKSPLLINKALRELKKNSNRISIHFNTQSPCL